MPCHLSKTQSEARARQRALDALKARLRAGDPLISIVGDRIVGWPLNDRQGWCDACALAEIRKDPRIRLRQTNQLKGELRR